MTTSLADLLKNRAPAEPPEIAVIKEFVRTHYDAPCRVTVQTRLIVIQVSSAALAGSLRMRLHELQQQIGSERRLAIRIS
ncbi:hypothetical protein E6P97_00315 [Patescibacteria group bacterium]|nr:MAG: hypothetical protein E6P97_00315 [Patescibacteria group bacterium]